MPIRQTIFWLHLASGLVAGAVIAIMSATGIAIAFEEEILAWIDRDVSRIEVSTTAAAPLSLEELRDRIQHERPGFALTRLVIPRDPQFAYQAFAGRAGPLYVDPRTGEFRDSEAHAAHDFIHELEEWHRWLGRPDGLTSTGRLVTGICNLAFLVLCLTGLYLWFPRRWSARALRPLLWFVGRYRGKARDFNWHNVFGFWSLPVLVVLVATAVPISFEWGHRLVFALFGEEAPKARNFGMMAVPPAVVPPPPAGAVRLALDAVVARAAERFPDWQEIGVNFPAPALASAAAVPLKLDITVPDYMPSRAYVPVEMDPFTGEILQAVRFQDRSPGLQVRVWIRFLHTGAGLGLPGKFVATLATAASLVLVYTGFALSWRRFFARKSVSAATP